MPTIDWTQRDVIYILAGSGVLLIVLSLVIRYWPAERGNFFFVYAIGIIGGLVLGTAGRLYYLPPVPDWFSTDAAWFTVERGDVVATMVQQGDVEPEDITHVTCKLHSPIPGAAAGNILWVIDEGKMVMEGDLLGELDDSEWQAQLKEKTITPERRKFLKEQIANCRILAPRDGFVIYYIEPIQRGLYGPAASQGEMVKEGQRLFSIFDPSKLVVKTHISPSQIARVRLGQAARIHIGRFPDRTLEGQVSRIEQISTKVQPGSNGAFYTVWLQLSDPGAELRPGMNAKVSLELARVNNVLRVPTETLLHSGNKTICFVKSGRQIEIRTVNTGISDAQFTAVGDGLKEGEEVLRGGAWQRFSVSSNARGVPGYFPSFRGSGEVFSACSAFSTCCRVMTGLVGNSSFVASSTRIK